MEKIVRKLNTTSLNVEMNSKKNIPSNVSIESKGIGIWKDEQTISLTLTSSGTVIVHEGKELFFKAEQLGEIEYYTTEEGSKYVYIKIKKVE